MALSEDQRIVAAAIDVLVSVNPDLLKRNARAERANRTLVDPFKLARLAEMIEERYPGAIEKTRRG